MSEGQQKDIVINSPVTTIKQQFVDQNEGHRVRTRQSPLLAFYISPCQFCQPGPHLESAVKYHKKIPYKCKVLFRSCLHNTKNVDNIKYLFINTSVLRLNKTLQL